MFKKGFVVFLVMVFSVVLLAAPAAAEFRYDYVHQVSLFIGDNEALVNGDVEVMDQAAYIKNGRTLVPFRFLGEALGAEVSWDSAARTAILNLNDSEVKVTINSKIAYIKGNQAALDVPAEIVGGRTFIPLRFVSEALGADVGYNGDLELVSVVLVDTYGWKDYSDTTTGDKIYYPADWTVDGSSDTFGITSPAGSEILLTVSQDEPSDIISTKTDEYSKVNFEKLEESPVDEANPDNGTAVAYMKFNPDDMEASEMCVLVVIKVEEGTFVFEMTSPITAGEEDMLVYQKMFSDL